MRKLIWYDEAGNAKVARGTGVDITASGNVIIFKGDSGEIILTSAMKFVIL